MGDLINTAAATIAERGLLPPGSFVLAMVSGGADSVALLCALAGDGLGRYGLAVLHVDHCLRGEQSRADAAFVAALCAELGVPCTVVRRDVAALARDHGLNLEDAGRQVRYEAAERVLRERLAESGAPRDSGRIATAHTLDDRIETSIMRLAQGAGASGLLALPYARGVIVRPLLDCTRADVLTYLGGLGRTWREDATNADTSRVRARVRAEVVPLLRDMNPRFDEAFARTVAVLGQEDELLDALARDAAGDIVAVETAPGGPRVVFDRARAAALPRALVRRMVRAALFAAFPDAARLEYEHIESLCDGMDGAAYARDLPFGLRARSEYATLCVSRDALPRVSFEPQLIEVPGEVRLAGAGVLSAQFADTRSVDRDPLTALIDADRLEGPVTVGPPQPGDRMRPLGMRGTKKLQDVLTDAKVPARKRPVTPVVRDGDRVVWVAGVRLDDRFRVGPGTERAVVFRWCPRDTGRATHT